MMNEYSFIIMQKEFDTWNEKKKRIHDKRLTVHFHEREVWFCALGVNIGYEQDGSGADLLRPVVIVRKFNNNIFIGFPLTKTKKGGPYYYPFTFIEGHESVAVLSQIRLIDAKRLRYKKGVVSGKVFKEMKKHFIRLLQ